MRYDEWQSLLVGSRKFYPKDFFHLCDLHPSRGWFACFPGIDIRFGNLDHLWKLLLVPTLRIPGLCYCDPEVLGHWWSCIKYNIYVCSRPLRSLFGQSYGHPIDVCSSAQIWDTPPLPVSVIREPSCFHAWAVLWKLCNPRFAFQIALLIKELYSILQYQTLIPSKPYKITEQR